MSEIAYRPRSVAEIVDASIQLFRRSYRELVAIMAIGYAPWVAASTIVSRSRGTLPGQPALLLNDLTGVLLLLAGGLWFAVVSAGCVAAASDRYLEEPTAVGQSLARALGRAPQIIATSLATWCLTVLGAILLLFPGFYLFARYATSPTVALLEGRSTLGSLQRASDLSRGKKLHILGALLVAWVIYFVIAITVAAVVGIAGLARFSGVIEAAISIGVAPLIAVISTVLYYDLRIRQEGFDVELMERQLRAAPETV